MKPKVPKLKKPKMLYQLVDQDGGPVELDCYYYSGSLKSAKTSKTYNSAGSIVNKVRRSIEYIKNIEMDKPYNAHNAQYIKLNDAVVTKDVLIAAILELKIQCFEVVPTKSIDLTFYLDKIT